MAANREVLTAIRSTAEREILDAPQDDLALTFDDLTTFNALASNEGLTPATRETLASQTSSASREPLVS